MVLLVATLTCGGGCTRCHAQDEQTVYLSADSLFALIDDRSRVLRLSAMCADEAVAEEDVVRLGRLPMVGAQLSVGWLGNGYLTERDFSGGMKVHNPHSANNFALDAMQVVYSGGAVSEGIRMARLKSRMAQLDVEQSRCEVRFVMLGLLTDLQCLYNRRRVLDENISLAELVIADMRARHGEGVVLGNDITRYELRMEEMRLQRVKVDEAVRTVNHRIADALSYDSRSTVFVPCLVDETATGTTGGEDYWQSVAQMSGVGLRKAALAVDMSLAARRVVAAERMPRLSLFAFGRLDSPIVIEVPVINKNFMYWGAGVTLSYNIASLYTTGRRMRRATAAVESSRAARELSAETLRGSVKEAYERHMTAIAEVATQEKSLELARRNYAVVSERYAAGMSLVTDMVDAANVRLAAELGLENARAMLLFSYYKLRYVANVL